MARFSIFRSALFKKGYSVFSSQSVICRFRQNHPNSVESMAAALQADIPAFPDRLNPAERTVLEHNVLIVPKRGTACLRHIAVVHIRPAGHAKTDSAAGRNNSSPEYPGTPSAGILRRPVLQRCSFLSPRFEYHKAPAPHQASDFHISFKIDPLFFIMKKDPERRKKRPSESSFRPSPRKETAPIFFRCLHRGRMLLMLLRRTVRIEQRQIFKILNIVAVFGVTLCKNRHASRNNTAGLLHKLFNRAPGSLPC